MGLVMVSEVKSKLPTKFTEGGIDWEVIERVGNLVFMRGRNNSDGKSIVYGCEGVRLDEQGFETVRSTLTSLDTDDPHRDRELMYQHFKRAIENDEANKLRKLKKEADAREQLRIGDLWQRKCNEAKKEQLKLVAELKELNMSDDVRAFEDKKIKEILTKLMQLEAYWHHAKITNV